MKRLKVRKETILALSVVRGGQEVDIPPTMQFCDPLKAERIEAPE